MGQTPIGLVALWVGFHALVAVAIALLAPGFCGHYPGDCGAGLFASSRDNLAFGATCRYSHAQRLTARQCAP